MSDAIDYFRAVNQTQKMQKAASDRAESARILRDEKIYFTEHNSGAHLIVQGKVGFIDFWPGTGKWFDRTASKRGFGIAALITLVKG